LPCDRGIYVSDGKERLEACRRRDIFTTLRHHLEALQEGQETMDVTYQNSRSNQSYMDWKKDAIMAGYESFRRVMVDVDDMGWPVDCDRGQVILGLA
jgi:hypothetical protein